MDVDSALRSNESIQRTVTCVKHGHAASRLPTDEYRIIHLRPPVWVTACCGEPVLFDTAPATASGSERLPPTAPALAGRQSAP
jgi:hypothetical protein